VNDQASGFYVLDTVTFNAVLFDIGNPMIEVDGMDLTVTTDQLLVSPELAGVLGNEALIGVDVGDALVEAKVALLQQRQIHDGVTSVGLDSDALAAAGLSLTGADGTVDPAPGGLFQVGFPIGEDTNFQFSLTGGTLAPLAGVVTHTGTVTFNDAVTVGDFEIGFDAARASDETGASGFYVRDTFSLGAILFDVGVPDNVALQDPDFTLGPADLLVSPEFADFLGNPALAGADAGDAQINASVKQIFAPFVEVKGWRRTSVNGDRSAAFPLSEVTNLRVDVGDGSDQVRVRGLDLPGFVSVDLGDGHYNSLTLDRLQSSSVSVVGGTGRDGVYLNRVLTDSLMVDTDDGSDYVSLKRTDVTGDTSVLLGDGSDSLVLFRSTLEGETTLDGGPGRFDSFFARFSEFEGEISNFRWKWIR
jgi:hypothetical protein